MTGDKYPSSLDQSARSSDHLAPPTGLYSPALSCRTCSWLSGLLLTFWNNPFFLFLSFFSLDTPSRSITNMAESNLESELSVKELKEKKQCEETENGSEAAPNGKEEENGDPVNEEDEDEEDVGDEEEEDGEGDEDDEDDDELDGPVGKRTAEDASDDEDEVEPKRQKTDK